MRVAGGHGGEPLVVVAREIAFEVGGDEFPNMFFEFPVGVGEKEGFDAGFPFVVRPFPVRLKLFDRPLVFFSDSSFAMRGGLWNMV